MSSLQYKVDVKENQTIYQHRRNRCTQKSLHVAHHVIYSQDIYEGYLQQLIFSVLMGKYDLYIPVGGLQVLCIIIHIYIWHALKYVIILIELLFLSQKRQHRFHAPDNFEVLFYLISTTFSQ